MTKILLAVTGASGQIYAARIAQIISSLISKGSAEAPTALAPLTLAATPLISHTAQPLHLDMVFTDTAKIVWNDELNYGNPNGPYPLPTKSLDNNSYYHPYASGSNAADVMIIIPCTMGTVGRIASGATTDLISRAADVMLKERRTLVIVPRENPFNLIHLRNLTTLAEA